MTDSIIVNSHRWIHTLNHVTISTALIRAYTEYMSSHHLTNKHHQPRNLHAPRVRKTHTCTSRDAGHAISTGFFLSVRAKKSSSVHLSSTVAFFPNTAMRNAAVCTVFPRPMSSPRIPPVFCLHAFDFLTKWHAFVELPNIWLGCCIVCLDDALLLLSARM